MSEQVREDSLISRRHMLCGGGVSVLTGMIAALLGDTTVLRSYTGTRFAFSLKKRPPASAPLGWCRQSSKAYPRWELWPPGA